MTLGKLGREYLKKNFSKVTKEDLEDFIESLKDEDYEESTKTTYLKILKPFFVQLHPEDPKFATWIRTGSFKPTVTPEDILSQDERSRMFAKCLSPRDKTMFQTLYESAARPKEFLSLWKSDVSFEDDAASLHVRKGKTGYPRDISVVQDAFPLLKNWIFNEHPLREENDFPLWIGMSRNSKHEPLQQLGLRRFFERVSQATGIQKRVVPYTLRHSRLTDLAREGANEALLSLIAGWRAGSKMPSVYIHLSSRDQKPALKKLLGLAKEEPQQERLLPKICPVCRTVNTNESHVCFNCKMALDTGTAIAMIQEKEDRAKKLEARVKEMEKAQRRMQESQSKTVQELEEVIQFVKKSRSISQK